MFRRWLHKYSGLMCTFTGTVACFGLHKITEEPTVLLVNIKGVSFDDIEISHSWCIQNENFNNENLKKGMIIEFEAIITPYGKGPKNKDGKAKFRDYGLANPTKSKTLGRDRKFDPVTSLPPSKRINVTEVMTPERSNIPKRAV